jgi:hypothetical protein
MALEDLTFSYRGLVFGQAQDIMVNRVEGLEGFEVRSSDSEQPRGDGSIRGLDYVGARTIAFELVNYETTMNGGQDYEANWAAVRSTFQPSREDDFPLTFKRPGQPERFIRCRPVQLTRVEKYLDFNIRGYPPVVLRAVDPRIYSTTERAGNVPVYATSAGGMDFPIAEFPVDFTGGTQSELVVQNDGAADAYPLIRVFGPVTGTCTGFTLTNSTTGQEITVTTTIGAGQILTADMDAAVTGSPRLVISLSGSSRYGDWQLPRKAFYLAPGSNTLRFEVAGSSTDVVCNLTWRDTWLD